MATLGTMKTRIASELDRSDISSQIASAIEDAIAIHERERFWFNVGRDLTFSTVDGQRIYTTADGSWIPNIVDIDAMFVTVSGQNRELVRADPAWLEYLTDSSSQESSPYHYAYFAKSIQLYPVPDAVYTVRALGHYRLTALSGDEDTNAWTTEAEQLIRRTAKAIIALDVTDDKQEAVLLDPVIQAHLQELRAETSRRTSKGRIKPTEF
jgi:hypothetical protein